MATPIYPLVTVDDLEAMPDDGNRYEIIEGELLMSRAPGLTHQRAFGKLFRIFGNYLDVQPIGEVLATPGIVFSDIDSVIPDIVFFTNERAKLILRGERIIAAPDLIVEIVSPGSENASRDRVIKRQLYAKFGVREYWIADPQHKTVEVLTLKDGVLAQSVLYQADDELTSALLPGLSFKVSMIHLVVTVERHQHNLAC
jgi:Uma2 family endonuclease